MSNYICKLCGVVCDTPDEDIAHHYSHEYERVRVREAIDAEVQERREQIEKNLPELKGCTVDEISASGLKKRLGLVGEAKR